jgi:phenylacetate-CoA oxygenase PaaH subunit
MLSAARTNVPEPTGELSTTEVDNFPIWEIFTQKKTGDAHQHAGSLSAPDATMAQHFAREHYGQDQECISIWVVQRNTFVSDEGTQETYEVFVQWKAGDRHEHVGEVEAGNGTEAKESCIAQFVDEKPYYTIWTSPISMLTKIDGSTDMIWRETTDQGYRLPRGYSRVVRQKWDALRAEKTVDTYQEEDLKETF